MKSDGHARPARTLLALGKLALPLGGHCSKRVGPCRMERWTPSLTTGDSEPARRHACRGVDFTIFPEADGLRTGADQFGYHSGSTTGPWVDPSTHLEPVGAS